MATRRKDVEEPEASVRRPGKTPEARENQMIALAMDAAEKQLRDGTASAQVVTHFLKAASTRERLERERIKLDNRLAEAKIEQMKSIDRAEKLFETAINAMRAYGGQAPQEFEDE